MYDATTMTAMNLESVFDRRLAAVFPSREDALKRLDEKKLRIYLGIDPTGQLHVGHLIPLLFLKNLAAYGHIPVIVIGDFTATIGDPTGKDKARVAQTEEQIREHMKGYLEQIQRILPQFDVEYNSKWLKPLTFADVLRLGSHVTVQQMIQRDMFQERLKQEKPIYIHEFMYPLMQGYDSVAMDIDGEVGGNDQTFNMLVGRDLMSEYLKKDKLVFATKLLIDPASGKKMSKTEDNFIALSDEPQEIRRKVLNMPDELTASVFELCTEVDMESLPNAREAKERLADELIGLIHGQSGVDDARKPLEVPLKGSGLAAFLKESDIAHSMSEAKDLITHRGVSINGTVIEEWDHEVHSGDEVQVGKGKFYKVK
jgi:tyrosyl-tRNA synthetase